MGLVCLIGEIQTAFWTRAVQPTHTQRPRDVRALGAEFVRAVRSGSDSARLMEEICALPSSQASKLGHSALELCSVKPRRGNADEVFRAHMAGAQLIVQCGLSFDPDTINREILPLLLRVPAVSTGRVADQIWNLRLQRILALGQLAPLTQDDRVDDALRSVLAHSEIQGKIRTDLFLTLADFEESFRIGSYMHDGDLRLRSKELCLDSVARLLDLTVENLADSTPETFSSVLHGLLPWAKIASISFIKVLPSLRSEPSEEVDRLTDRILDSMEWMLLRRFGFPGFHFQQGEREKFEAARSLIALAYGIFVAGDSVARERFEALRLPQSEGPQYLGTALLHSMKRVGVECAVEWGRDLARDSLARLAKPHELGSQETVEALALAWHLGTGKPADFEKAMEFVRNPTAQLLCAKALNDIDPWGRAAL